MGEKIVGSFFVLILIYLLAKNAASANNTLNAIGSASAMTIAALQGSPVSGGSALVGSNLGASSNVVSASQNANLPGSTNSIFGSFGS